MNMEILGLPHDYYDFSPRLKDLYIESLIEKRIITKEEELKNLIIKDEYAIYPKRYYERVRPLTCKKYIDFCFIGTINIDQHTQKNRKWILEFIKRKFTDFSYLQLTDQSIKSHYIRMGIYDATNKINGMVPKFLPLKRQSEFDINYFTKLAASMFSLCPAGDAFYSMRFYESLMCKSIPIVKYKNETYRTREEQVLDYKYYLTTDKHIFREEWVEHNYRIFMKYHTL